MCGKTSSLREYRQLVWGSNVNGADFAIGNANPKLWARDPYVVAVDSNTPIFPSRIVMISTSVMAL